MRRRAPDPSERLRAVRSLPRDVSSCTPLLDAVGDVSLDVARAALARLLPLAGQAEMTALRERMLSLDIGIVGDVAAALRTLGDRRATDIAVAGLERASPYERHKAAIALRSLCDPAARAALLRALDDPETPVRRVAIEALARLPGDRRTVDVCRQQLSDRDPSVRAAAVSALAVLDDAAGTTLRPILTDPHPTVRLAVAAAVETLDGEEVRVLVGDDDAAVRAAVLDALSLHPRPALLPVVAAALGDPSWHVRRAACDALGASGRPESSAALLRLLVDEHATVRGRALLALERLLGDELWQALEQALDSAPARLRRTIVELLGTLGHTDSLPRLSGDPDPDVRIAVVRSLARTTSPEARAALGYLAGDADAGVRNAVATVLEDARVG